jgi:hypothetical protein
VRFDAEPPDGLPRSPDVAVVGKWFDGSRRRDVEEVTWLSPWTVLRLGWDWETSRRLYDGHLTFLVRLAAFERQDPLELGGDTAPGDDVSRAGFTVFALNGRGKSTPLSAEVVLRYTQRARDPLALLRIPPLAFVHGDPPDDLPLNVGRNQIAFYEVRVPINRAAEAAVGYRVLATTARRTRTAEFRRWPRINSGR